jgi:hypothetical protein
MRVAQLTSLRLSLCNNTEDQRIAFEPCVQSIQIWMSWSDVDCPVIMEFNILGRSILVVSRFGPTR